ncbi:MAG: universal stress protein [Nitrospirales bacterium]|nr:MAG: universal stress protein [Nitrospirales bacterium]
MKILVAVDSSKDAREAIRYVASVEWPKKSEIYLLHVIELKDAPPLMPSGGPFNWHQVIDRARGKLVAKAEIFLKRTKKEILKLQPLHVQSLVREGLPGAEILQAAKDYQSDLIILGTRGLSNIKRFLLGSTSDWVMRDASCSVLLVRGKLSRAMMGKTAAKILLATDGSSDVSHLVHMLRLLTCRTPPKVTVAHVIGRPAYLEGWYFGNGKAEFMRLAERLLKKMEKDGASHLENMRQRVKKFNMKVDTVLTKGDPADEILKTAERLKAALIIVGSKGFKGSKPIPLGGVVRKIARYAPCSVLIIRPGRPQVSQAITG